MNEKHGNISLIFETKNKVIIQRINFFIIVSEAYTKLFPDIIFECNSTQSNSFSSKNSSYLKRIKVFLDKFVYAMNFLFVSSQS